MRYPLVAFLFVFLLGPYTAHAMLTGAARIQPKAEVNHVLKRSNGTMENRHLGGGVLMSIRQNAD
jgi:multisubunit Na+/H+ antiporter MnhG subunit